MMSLLAQMTSGPPLRSNAGIDRRLFGPAPRHCLAISPAFYKNEAIQPLVTKGFVSGERAYPFSSSKIKADRPRKFRHVTRTKKRAQPNTIAGPTMTSSAQPPRRRIPASSTTSIRPNNSLSLLILALFAVLSTTNYHVSAHAPSTALFDAIDADGDGQISPEDWDVSMTKITQSLGIDTHELDGVAAQHLNGGEVGAMGRNEAAAHRDGLSGENLVPKKQLGGAFNPAAGSPSRKMAGGAGDGKKKLSFTKAFTASVAMILATEIGDKTFFIAAVLSMRNDRAAVFGGAILALIVMTILR